MLGPLIAYFGILAYSRLVTLIMHTYKQYFPLGQQAYGNLHTKNRVF